MEKDCDEKTIKMKKKRDERIRRKAENVLLDRRFPKTRKKFLSEAKEMPERWSEDSIPACCIKYGLNRRSPEDLHIMKTLLGAKKEPTPNNLPTQIFDAPPAVNLEIIYPEVSEFERVKYELTIIYLLCRIDPPSSIPGIIELLRFDLSETTKNYLADTGIDPNELLDKLPSGRWDTVNLRTVKTVDVCSVARSHVQEIDGTLKFGTPALIPKLYLEVTPNLTRSEIDDNWLSIKEERKKVFDKVKQVRRRQTSERNKQWHLENLKGKTPNQIRDEYNKGLPEDQRIDDPETIKKGISRHRNKIHYKNQR